MNALPNELINLIFSFKEATPTSILIKNHVAELKQKDRDEAIACGECDPEDPADVEYYNRTGNSLSLYYRAFDLWKHCVYTHRYTTRGAETGLFVKKGTKWVVEEVKTRKNAWA